MQVKAIVGAVDSMLEPIVLTYLSGLQPRTQEILCTIGLQHTLDQKGNRMSEIAFWSPNGVAGRFLRRNVGPEVTCATLFPYVLVVDQGNTEAAFEAGLGSRGFKIDRQKELIHYAYNASTSSTWPLTAYVKDHISGVIEVWHTRYILGSDGARSIVRHIAGVQVLAQGSHEVWAVADVLADTDFPDIRRHCVVWSAQRVCTLMPNSQDGIRICVRLSPEDINQLDAGVHGSFAEPPILFPEMNSTLLFEIIQIHVRDILSPYKIDITKVSWIGRYRVSQGIADRFTDPQRHVYLLGEACHTHSMHGCQGMNLGMADAYNLTWKLALVLKDIAKPELLDTYEIERRHIAHLINDFDIKFANIHAQKQALDLARFYVLNKQSQKLTSGCDHRYPEGLITNNIVRAQINQAAIEPLTAGRRLHTMTLTRHVDGTIVDLFGEMPSIDRFHLCIFVGKLLSFAVFQALSNYLVAPESPLSYFSKNKSSELQSLAYDGIRHNEKNDGSRYLDLYLIHTSNHLDIELDQLPNPFQQWTSRVYEDVGGIGHASHGVSEMHGVMALVRPDGYISMVTNLDNSRGVLEFMKAFMVNAKSDLRMPEESMRRTDFEDAMAS